MDFMTSYLYRSYSSVEGEFLLEKRRFPESPTKVFLNKTCCNISEETLTKLCDKKNFL